MDLDRSTGIVLRYGVYLSISIMLVGVLVSQLQGDMGDLLMNVGVALLVLTPFFSIVASAVSLYSVKDYKWLRIALAVLAISIIGIVVAFVV